MGVDVLEPQSKSPETKQAPCQIRKGPIEGIVIVDGRPQMERLDMSGISFESILALQRFKEQYLDKKDGD
ncbi:MAG: hypothetical protein K2H01_11610 [Ruminococcus sp.]|nr:hypothetical protein [Ruminococcus sp.]